MCRQRGDGTGVKNVIAGKVAGPSEVSLDLIDISGDVGIQVMAALCQRVLGGLAMLVEWVLNVVFPMFKEIGDIRNCSCYRAEKVLEHRMTVVMVKRFCRILTTNEM